MDRYPNNAEESNGGRGRGRRHAQDRVESTRSTNRDIRLEEGLEFVARSTSSTQGGGARHRQQAPRTYEESLGLSARGGGALIRQQATGAHQESVGSSTRGGRAPIHQQVPSIGVPALGSSTGVSDGRTISLGTYHYVPPNQLKAAFPPMSENYRGSRQRTANYSAPIPDNENTSVWIKGLAPDTTHASLLRSLRGTGKVWATVINPPSGQHATAAAKVQFWTVEGRENFMRKSAAGDLEFEDGYMPLVELNRHKTASEAISTRSRVLRITGPVTIVHEATLRQIFDDAGIQYDIEMIENESDAQLGRMLFYFGSYRLQAQKAHEVLMTRASEGRRVARLGDGDAQGWDRVHVGFALDPCDAGESPGRESLVPASSA